MRTACMTLVLVASIAAPCAAQDPLDEARTAYADGAFDRAQSAYERALTMGGLDPTHLAEAELYLGVIARAASDPAAMRAHFERAVAVDPTVHAPADLPPRGRRSLEEARAARSGVGIQIHVEVPTVPAQGPIPVHAVVEGAPEGMVTELRFTLGTWTAIVPLTPGSVDVPDGQWPHEAAILLVEAFTSAHNVASRAEIAALPRPEPEGVVQPVVPVDAVVDDTPDVTHVVTPDCESAAARGEPPPVGCCCVEPPLRPTPLVEEPALWVIVGLGIIGAVAALVLGLTLHDRYVVGVPHIDMLTFP